MSANDGGTSSTDEQRSFDSGDLRQRSIIPGEEHKKKYRKSSHSSCSGQASRTSSVESAIGQRSNVSSSLRHVVLRASHRDDVMDQIDRRRTIAPAEREHREIVAQHQRHYAALEQDDHDLHVDDDDGFTHDTDISRPGQSSDLSHFDVSPHPQGAIGQESEANLTNETGAANHSESLTTLSIEHLEARGYRVGFMTEQMRRNYQEAQRTREADSRRVSDEYDANGTYSPTSCRCVQHLNSVGRCLVATVPPLPNFGPPEAPEDRHDSSSHGHDQLWEDPYQTTQENSAASTPIRESSTDRQLDESNEYDDMSDNVSAATSAPSMRAEDQPDDVIEEQQSAASRASPVRVIAEQSPPSSPSMNTAIAPLSPVCGTAPAPDSPPSSSSSFSSSSSSSASSSSSSAPSTPPVPRRIVLVTKKIGRPRKAPPPQPTIKTKHHPSFKTLASHSVRDFKVLSNMARTQISESAIECCFRLLSAIHSTKTRLGKIIPSIDHLDSVVSNLRFFLPSVDRGQPLPQIVDVRVPAPRGISRRCWLKVSAHVAGFGAVFGAQLMSGCNSVLHAFLSYRDRMAAHYSQEMGLPVTSDRVQRLATKSAAINCGFYAA